MKTVVVGSNNPVKLETTKEAFSISFPQETFTFESCSAESNIPDQPFGFEETRTGAKNRAHACSVAFPDADYYVGLEGGLEEVDGEFWVFAVMCVQNKEGKRGFGRTGSFLLPPNVSERIHKGEELGVATDVVFSETNSKHKGGTIAILTNSAITRKDFYRDAVVFALIPFAKPELY